jgi:hypothetical protein
VLLGLLYVEGPSKIGGNAQNHQSEVLDRRARQVELASLTIIQSFHVLFSPITGPSV